MKVLVIGAGEVGFTITERLTTEGHDVVVIEEDEEKAFRLGEMLDIQVIPGSGSDPEVVREAGLENTDLVIAVTDQDEVNLVSCVIARTYGPDHLKSVARVRAIPLASDAAVARKFGIDLVINPERTAAQRLLDAINHPGASELVRFAEGKLLVAGVHLDRSLPYLGRTLREVGAELQIPALIGVAVEGDRVLIPKGDYELRQDTFVYLITTPAYIDAAMAFLLPDEDRVEYVTVAGSTYLARHISRKLAAAGVRVKLIVDGERDAFRLASELEGVLVIHGDPMDGDLFEEERLSESDIFIAATVSDERNVVAAHLAKRAGIDSTAVLIRNHLLAKNLARTGDIDVILNPRHDAVDAVLQFVRKGRVHQVTSFPKAENAELMEIEIVEASPISGKKLREVLLPRDVLVGAVIRGEDVLIPRGDDVLKPGDRVLFIALHHAIGEVEQLVKEGI